MAGKISQETSHQIADQLGHYLFLAGSLRCALATTTHLAEDARRLHNLDPVASIALGQTLTGSALLGSIQKHPSDYISINLRADGPLGKVIAECNGGQHLRGYVQNPQVMIVLGPGAEAPETVAEALGTSGQMTITRGRLGSRQPYTTITDIKTGEIAADLATYLKESEQIPSAVAVGVKLDLTGQVCGAGGLLLQKMGGADLEDDLLSELEEKLTGGLRLSERIAEGSNIEMLLSLLTPILGQPELLLRRPLAFQCRCSRERTSAALFTLGLSELADIEAETGKIETKCQYCAATYRFELAEFDSQ